MSTNWNGKYAKEFVTLFELYGTNPTVFEKKFKIKYEQVFGKVYNQNYKATKMAYQRHATIHRFLNYKKKNLCDLSNDFKYFGAWLMKRQHTRKIKTNMGFWGILDENNEVLSEWESENDENDDEYEDFDDEIDEDDDLMIINTNNNNKHQLIKNNKVNKKRKLNSKNGMKYITSYDDFIDLTDSFDHHYNGDAYNNNNNDKKSKQNGNKRSNKYNNNINKKKIYKIKGVNDIDDAMSELQAISPKLKNKSTKKQNKTDTTVLMHDTLVELQKITKANKQQLTIDNLKDILKICVESLTSPDLDLINLLIGIGFNKLNLFFSWLKHQNTITTSSQRIPANVIIRNVLVLMKMNKMEEFINLWLLIRTTTNDDIDSIIFHLNEYMNDINGCIPFRITNACEQCNISIGECVICQKQHKHCVMHLPATETCIPPDIDINDEENININDDMIEKINGNKEEKEEDDDDKTMDMN